MAGNTSWRAIGEKLGSCQNVARIQCKKESTRPNGLTCGVDCQSIFQKVDSYERCPIVLYIETSQDGALLMSGQRCFSTTMWNLTGEMDHNRGDIDCMGWRWRTFTTTTETKVTLIIESNLDSDNRFWQWNQFPPLVFRLWLSQFECNQVVTWTIIHPLRSSPSEWIGGHLHYVNIFGTPLHSLFEITPKMPPNLHLCEVNLSISIHAWLALPSWWIQ